jgi:predicted anti-sigma-YlaC factor YlaD
MSAQLDGEDDPGDAERLDGHLAGCADCRTWLDRAATVNRLTRTAVAAAPPDLSAAILAAAPVARPAPRRRLTAALHVALGAVGAVQLVLGLAQVGGGTAAAHTHAAAGLAATTGHLWHESAAWNVAVGAGFLLVGVRRSRPTGLVPMLTAFVAMLVLLSVNDLSTGRVDVDRLVSHGFVLAGYAIVIALARGPAGPAGPADRQGGRQPWRARFDEEPVRPAPGPRLRLLPGGLPPATARHDDARRAA